MGGWALEVAKMGLYMTFPVGLFYYFNQPQFFEEWVIQKKREMYPPENSETDRMLDEFMRQQREKREKEILGKLAKLEAEQKK